MKDTVGHDAESLLASKDASTLAVFASFKGILIGQSCQTRAEVLCSFITTTVRDKSQVTPQGSHR